MFLLKFKLVALILTSLAMVCVSATVQLQLMPIHPVVSADLAPVTVSVV